MSDEEKDSLRHSDGNEQESASQQVPALSETGKLETSSQTQGAVSRDELLEKARMFLASPSVQSQDVDAKRTFLREKGLSERDIDDLLRTLPSQLPQIPPRTYPLPPPSNLPVLLLRLARLVSWLAGGSAILLFLYHRLLLPRIAETSSARQALKSHHLSLLRQLTTSLAALKESQAESFSVLPRPESPWKEVEPFSKCRNVKEILDVVAEQGSYSQIPHVTLLRCGIQDVSIEKGGDAQPTTAELFGYLERRISWLTTDDGLKFEEKLWSTLTTAPVFKKNLLPSSFDSSPITGLCWQYLAPAPATDPPILKSVDALKSALSRDRTDSKTTSQLTLQSLSDLTGYITSQVYLPFRAVGPPLANPADTGEDEVRREIKALKGLVLNRRSFMASIPRPPSGLASNHTTP